jgi:hypothetical protein
MFVDLFGLYKGLDSLGRSTHGLGIVCLHLLQALPVCFLAPRELRVSLLRHSYLCNQSLLMPFLCHFQDCLCVVWFLDLAMFIP